MNQVVPPSLLCDFQLSVPECSAPSRKKSGRLLNLNDRHEIFFPSQLNAQSSWASLRIGWNSIGLGLSLNVSGKQQKPAGSSDSPELSDRLAVWIDTRPSGQVHRATQYCHSFGLLPVDELTGNKPSALVQEIAQQREKRIESNPLKIRQRVHQLTDGYEMEVWIPGDQLYGFREVEELRRLGFYCIVHDSELGEQPLTVADDFPVTFNPSLWLTLDLV